MTKSAPQSIFVLSRRQSSCLPSPQAMCPSGNPATPIEKRGELANVIEPIRRSHSKPPSVLANSPTLGVAAQGGMFLMSTHASAAESQGLSIVVFKHGDAPSP